jgi:Ni,Fe-hydrogenase I cytochrome b subunit
LCGTYYVGCRHKTRERERRAGAGGSKRIYGKYVTQGMRCDGWCKGINDHVIMFLFIVQHNHTNNNNNSITLVSRALQ